jgi:starch synthase
MTAVAPLYIKKVYKDDPSFRDAKVVMSVYEDAFVNNFSGEFTSKLMLRGIHKKDMAMIIGKKVSHAMLLKHAIHYCDGIVQNSKHVDGEIMEYARENGKPILDYVRSVGEYAEACDAFYERV